MERPDSNKGRNSEKQSDYNFCFKFLHLTALSITRSIPMKKIVATLLLAAGLLALTFWLVSAASPLAASGDHEATILPMGLAQ